MPIDAFFCSSGGVIIVPRVFWDAMGVEGLGERVG